MDIAKAFLMAGLLIAALAFIISYLAYRNGDITPEQDQQDEWGLGGTYDDERPSNNFLHQKWVKADKSRSDLGLRSLSMTFATAWR